MTIFYGEVSQPRNILTAIFSPAKFPYGEISSRKNFLTEIFPYGGNSYCKIFGHGSWRHSYVALEEQQENYKHLSLNVNSICFKPLCFLNSLLILSFKVSWAFNSNLATKYRPIARLIISSTIFTNQLTVVKLKLIYFTTPEWEFLKLNSYKLVKKTECCGTRFEAN